jgi:ElaB/YqjD/DUF883 family membrane-anchored ribosome-binding protein
MDNESEVIRHQMEDTRSSLTEKLETLETKVVDTVHETTSAVAETVENVKEAVQDTVNQVTDTVHDTVQSVKNTLNIARHVNRHPWPVLCGSVAVGFFLGSFLGRRRSGRGDSSDAGKTINRAPGNGFARKASHTAPSTASEPVPTSSTPTGPGWLSTLAKTLGPEVDKLKSMAIGTVGGVVRDLVTKAVPAQMGDQLGHLVDDITTKLGGEIVAGRPSSAQDSNESAMSDLAGREMATSSGSPY